MIDIPVNEDSPDTKVFKVRGEEDKHINM